MSNQRNYEKVSGGSNNKRWTPNKDQGVTYSEQNPATLEGYYISSTVLTSKDGPFTAHEIQTLNGDGSLGECFDVSLGVGLDNTLKNITLGTFICINFKGKALNPATGRNYNATDVFQDKNAIPYKDLSLKEGVSPAPAATVEKKAVATGNKNPAANNNPFPDDDDLPF